jgi:3-oxoacyl-(acyl-carrier-protein) synthase
MTRDAVITGCGVVAANGIGRAAFADALRAGRSGIGDLVAFDASDTARERAAEIHSFDPAPFLRSPKNYLDRNSALAFAAAEMAVRESALPLPQLDRAFGVACGSMAGNIESLAAFAAKVAEKGPKLAPPFLFPHTYYNTTAGLLSIEYGLNGPHGQFCSGGAAGLEALLFAAECVRRGRTDAMLAGGVEAFHERLFRLAVGRGWLSPIGGGEERCRPFDPARNGAILGEGAAFFIIESAESARSRGAQILARIAGTSLPGAVGVPRPDAIFAAAGGYPAFDAAEAESIRVASGGPSVPVVAVKSLLGETLGAAGPLALAAALVAMEGRFLPGVDGATSAFPDLDLVAKPRRTPVGSALICAGGPEDERQCSLLVHR